MDDKKAGDVAPLLTCERMHCHYPSTFTLTGQIPGPFPSVIMTDDILCSFIPDYKKLGNAGKLRNWFETLAHSYSVISYSYFMMAKRSCKLTSSSHAILELYYIASSE